jgi:hypothetical protein
MEVSGQLHAPAALPSGKELMAPLGIGGWMGPKAGLDAVVKRKIPSPYRNSNAPIIQPRAQRYTAGLSRLIIIHMSWNKLRIIIRFAETSYV